MINLSIGIVLGILVLMITCNALILLRDKKTINLIDSRISELDRYKNKGNTAKYR